MIMTKGEISSGEVAQAQIRLAELQCDGDRLYWIESHPSDGRLLIFSKRGSDCACLTPDAYSVRSRVHEYGGGAYLVHAGIIYFVNDADQQIYIQRPHADPVSITSLTPGVTHRYADLCWSDQGVIAVRESHADTGVTSALVLIDVAGDAAIRVLHDSDDFYAAPNWCASTSQLAFVTWSMGQMPWSETYLHTGSLIAGVYQTDTRLSDQPCAAYYAPQWHNGQLYVVADHSGWWNLYALTDQLDNQCVISQECGYPAWIFATQTYTIAASGSIWMICGAPGQQQLGQVVAGEFHPLSLPVTSFEPYLAVSRDGVCHVLARSPTDTLALLAVKPDGQYHIVRKPVPVSSQLSCVSVGQAISFPVSDEATAHAFLYPPNQRTTSPSPLLVMCHGGPTSQVDNQYSAVTQFFTSRGMAVLDVNYRGSTGYGRAYRQALDGQWGLRDSADCIAAVEYCVQQGWVDESAIFIRGKSSAGLTVLNALLASDLFAGGVSYYGVLDLLGLMNDTHRFEAGYLDSLIGPSTDLATYQQRSPLTHASQLTKPVLFLQGMQDFVVPPLQVKAMLAAMNTAAVVPDVLYFETEGHGFRQAENIQAAIEAEWAFYQRVMVPETAV